jgi:hypothetical protein
MATMQPTSVATTTQTGSPRIGRIRAQFSMSTLGSPRALRLRLKALAGAVGSAIALYLIARLSEVLRSVR